MNKKKFLTLFLTIIVMILLLKAGFVVYRFFTDKKFISCFDKQKKELVKEQKDNAYQLKRMIPLIQASKRVKDFEHIYFTQALDTPHIQSQTIRDLIKALAQERVKLKRYIERLKYRAEASTSTKKLRSLLYYLCILEENIQDLEIILASRARTHQ